MSRFIKSDEAEWSDDERPWAYVQQFPPKQFSVWPLVKVAATFMVALAAGFCVVVAIGGFSR